jgi:hypothetical protein
VSTLKLRRFVDVSSTKRKFDLFSKAKNFPTEKSAEIIVLGLFKINRKQ